MTENFKEKNMYHSSKSKWHMFILLILPSLLIGSCHRDDQDVRIISDKSRVWMGVHVAGVSDKLLQNMDLDHGVKVVRVFEGSPAEAAGLEEDDIITEFDGHAVKDADKLADLVQQTGAGEEAEVVFVRSGEQKEATVKIADRPARSYFRHGRIRLENAKRTWLGVETTALNEQLRAYFGVPDDLGVLVKKVVEKSPAEKSGLRAGDIIIGVADRKIRSTRDLARSIRYYDPDETVEIKIIRKEKESTLSVRLGETDSSMNFRFYGDGPGKFNWHDMDIEIPDIDIDHDIQIEIDKNKLENLEREIEEKINVKTIELKEKLDALQQELEQKMERISIRQI